MVPMTMGTEGSIAQSAADAGGNVRGERQGEDPVEQPNREEENPAEQPNWEENATPTSFSSPPPPPSSSTTQRQEPIPTVNNVTLLPVAEQDDEIPRDNDNPYGLPQQAQYQDLLSVAVPVDPMGSDTDPSEVMCAEVID